MRLIDAETLGLEEFNEENIPPYAILSHTWGATRSEISFQEMQDLSPELKDRQGYAKITGCCAQALHDGLKWVWVDTCCIDKSSSAELSESINSMFGYYQKAEKCYAYLADVQSSIGAYVLEDDPVMSIEFDKSKWFTRGWTLQELLAPENVEFYSRSWGFLGTKATLSSSLSRITRIPMNILEYGSLSSVSVAMRMSWAAGRVTTRLEDVAYSLLGIFNVHMPLLYGEGEKAFQRLQEEIMKESDDQSLFVWEYHPSSKREAGVGSLLARSPTAFANSANIVPFRDAKANEPYSLTNKGIRIKLVLLPYQRSSKSATEVTAVLECRADGPFVGLIGITLTQSLEGSDHYTRVLTPSENPRTIRFETIFEQQPKTIFVRKSIGVPDISLVGRFVIRVSPESSFRVSGAYPSNLWHEIASIMGTNDQGLGILVFERPADRHFVVLLRSSTPDGTGSDVCRIIRDRQTLRQSLKPYYGMYEHLEMTYSHKTSGPLEEGDSSIGDFASLKQNENFFDSFMYGSLHGKVSCRSGHVFGQQMFIVDVS